jgi:vitamin-K-epoxide reductase (warfarin-sensitive)
MLSTIIFLSLLGFSLSFYAYILEKKIKSNPTYKAVCDISDTFSCSKPLLSEYGEIFGFSNSLLGMLFYATMAILAFLGRTNLLFYLSVASLFASAFLAYILYFRIKTVCLICTTIYGINILLFLVMYTYH